MNRLIAPALLPMALTACATAQAGPHSQDTRDGMPVREPAALCNAEAVQYHVGHTVSAEMGQAILVESGARQLRWVPPRSAVTMDYRPDRLTVSYDDDLMIDRVSCG